MIRNERRGRVSSSERGRTASTFLLELLFWQQDGTNTPKRAEAGRSRPPDPTDRLLVPSGTNDKLMKTSVTRGSGGYGIKTHHRQTITGHNEGISVIIIMI